MGETYCCLWEITSLMRELWLRKTLSLMGGRHSSYPGCTSVALPWESQV